MLPGVTVKKLERHVDERGSFTELTRQDWKTLLGNDNLVQANLSVTYPGIVRAWHRHLKGQVDYFITLNGAVKICVYDDETKELDEILSSNMNMQVVKVPGHYWHGYKALGTTPAFNLYFTTRLYDYKDPDEERRLWNDPNVIPTSINGDAQDPRANKPWEWLKLPNK
jgi:dTDP-4-dehydrorhamnose 3,5-epimerase